MKCAICSKEGAKKGYCNQHKMAYRSIAKKYDEWERALEISWEEYLSEIAKNPSTGEWAKEVAEHLIENGEKQDVKQD
jgi:hypothetical protein